MLETDSLFVKLQKASKTSIEKDSIKNIFSLIRNFYYVLDIHNGCNVNLRIFNYLFSDSEIYTFEQIADRVYVSDKTIRRFKKKTEKILIVLIKNDEKFKVIKHMLKKHKIA